MATELTYQYLAERPEGRKRQLYIKGRGCLTARDVVGTMISNNLTPEETAESYSVPLEAVQEAWQYYQDNQVLIESETREERRLGGID